MVFGVILIFVGALFLLDKLGILPVGASELIWPLVIIGLGIGMIIKESRKDKIE